MGRKPLYTHLMQREPPYTNVSAPAAFSDAIYLHPTDFARMLHCVTTTAQLIVRANQIRFLASRKSHPMTSSKFWLKFGPDVLNLNLGRPDLKSGHV